MRGKLLAGLAFMATASVAEAQVIGDKDCFGTIFGVQSPTSCDGQTFSIPGLSTNGRSVAEASATNGAQQTDFYSALFSPLPETFTIRWTLVSPLSAAQLSYRSYGLQAQDFGAFTATLNGFTFANFLNFQDGSDVVQTHATTLNETQLNRVNTMGYAELTISRGWSNDAVAFDYFELSQPTAQVPEPSSLALVAAGAAGLFGVARRRKQRA